MWPKFIFNSLCDESWNYHKNEGERERERENGWKTEKEIGLEFPNLAAGLKMADKKKVSSIERWGKNERKRKKWNF